MKAATEISAVPWSSSEITNLADRSFFTTMEASAAGTLATDRSGVIVWINDRYCRLLGCGASQVVGRPIASVLPRTRLPEVLTTGRPIMLDTMRHRGIDYLVSRFPVFDPDSNVIGAFGFVLNSSAEESPWALEQGPRIRDSKRLPSAPNEQQRGGTQQRTFVGVSHHANRVRLLVEKCAATTVPVLVTGPTGSGKEVVAQMVHSRSGRRLANFVAVNVGAIPEALFEAEFFGSAPGAYTGADRRGRPGKLQLADGGTLFLDELGDMPLGAQVKLLRFLETGEYEALGSNQLKHADVRLVAATSVDLERAVRSRKFRADLYYRLAVFPIRIAGLRERSEDISELCETLLEQIIDKYDGQPIELLPCAFTALRSHTWPGNARELRNLLERCAIFADGAPIDGRMVKEMIGPNLEADDPLRPSSCSPRSLAAAVEAIETQEIALALVECNGSTSHAARRLGISRTTLYKKARQFGFSVGDNQTE